MLSFLQLFVRVALRNKSYTILNISGLAIGMAAFILIMLWVSDELSYDSYNVNADRIYRVKMFYRFKGVEKTATYCPAPLAEAIRNDYPEVEKAARFRDYGSSIIKYGSNIYTEKRIIYADSTIFDIFTIPVIEGIAEKALVVPYTVAISESMAKKYFGQEDPVNKILKFDNNDDYRVTAVFKDIPEASHFHFDFIASLYSTDEYKDRIWLSANFQTYVLLNKGSDPRAFEKKLSYLIEKYVAPQAAKGFGVSWDEIQKTSDLRIEFSIQNVRDLHLTTGITGEFEAAGDSKYVYLFTLIAIFIILLACINFTNLATAQSSARLKEVGIRKVFGVQRTKLSMQFMFESFLIVFTAYIVAMILTEISLPFFNDLTGKSLSIKYFDIRFIGTVLGLIIIVSIIAGSYPTIYLSSFRPIAVLKREMITGKKRTTFRGILVAGQFIITLILLSSTLILYKQMKFIQKYNLGYDKEQLLVIENTYLLRKNIDNFRNQVLANPQIINATQTGFLPSPSNRSNGSIFVDGIVSNNPLFCTHFSVDYEYVNTFDMKIIRGRAFSKEFPSDSSAVIINEAAAKLLGYEDPIGRKIGTFKESVDINNPVMSEFNIIGVVKDFNYTSLHEPVSPLAMYIKRSTSMIAFKIRKDDSIPQLLAFIKSKWTENAPDQPFEYDFITESLNRQYRGEIRLGIILGIFTGLALFVSCLGLIGLALFASEQRKKEIGLRKVNGSGITDIIWLLIADFTKPILIAFVIACPVSYYMMSKWLENFAYQINISWWIFIITGLLSYIIAMCAVGYLSYRAATTNPVETLKNE